MDYNNDTESNEATELIKDYLYYLLLVKISNNLGVLYLAGASYIILNEYKILPHLSRKTSVH